MITAADPREDTLAGGPGGIPGCVETVHRCCWPAAPRPGQSPDRRPAAPRRGQASDCRPATLLVRGGLAELAGPERGLRGSERYAATLDSLSAGYLRAQ